MMETIKKGSLFYEKRNPFHRDFWEVIMRCCPFKDIFYTGPNTMPRNLSFWACHRLWKCSKHWLHCSNAWSKYVSQLRLLGRKLSWKSIIELSCAGCHFCLGFALLPTLPTLLLLPMSTQWQAQKKWQLGRCSWHVITTRSLDWSSKARAKEA